MPDGEGVCDGEEVLAPPVEGVASGVFEDVPDAGGVAVGVGEAIGGETVELGDGVGGAGLTSIDSGLLLAVCGPDRLLTTWTSTRAG